MTAGRLLVALFVLMLLAASAEALVQCRQTEVCVAPSPFSFTGSPTPFDAPVRFGGEVRMYGETLWAWIKIGEPRRKCSAQQMADRNAYGQACRTKVGDVLMITARFRDPALTVSEIPATVFSTSLWCVGSLVAGSPERRAPDRTATGQGRLSFHEGR